MKELAFEVLTGVALRAISILADVQFDVIRSCADAAGLEHGLLSNFTATPLTVKRVIFHLPFSDS